MKRKKTARIAAADKKRLLLVKEIIEAHPEQRHTLSILSQIAQMNRDKLTYGFKKITGKSIHQFVISTRMENAKRMLQTSDKPIKAIALSNGYSNAENFINAFKKYFGSTPSHFVGKKNGGD